MPLISNLVNNECIVFIKSEAFDVLYNIYIKNFEVSNPKRREYSVIWFRQMWRKLNYIAGISYVSSFSILDIENAYNPKRPLYGRLQFETKNIFSRHNGKYYRVIIVDSFNFRLPYTDIYGGSRVTLKENINIANIIRLTECDLRHIIRNCINEAFFYGRRGFKIT